MHPRPTAPTSRPSAPRMRVGIAMETLPCREPADCPSRYRHRAAERLSRLGERRVDRQVNGAGFAEVVVSWRATETREKPGGAGGLELCAPARRSRTCCGSWRRGCSACWSGAMAASTPARTRSRRRCWRPRPSGRPKGCRPTPTGWLITVASRRRIELLRGEVARRRREESAAALAPPGPEPAAVDDTLTLLLLCCHPSLTQASQVALTLRAVGGLSTAEIARAFLVPEATIGQRISRAKQRIKASGAEFRMPPQAERSQRMAAVLQVLYLIFNEGYTASSGPALHRVELTSEVIRLTRQLHDRLPDDGEVAGLLALMLLTDARRPART